jgi:hypothetical protein
LKINVVTRTFSIGKEKIERTGMGADWKGRGKGVSVGERKLWENTRIPHTSNPPHSQGKIERVIIIEMEIGTGVLYIYKICTSCDR